MGSKPVLPRVVDSDALEQCLSADNLYLRGTQELGRTIADELEADLAAQIGQHLLGLIDQFDGHGWNRASDRSLGRLVGKPQQALLAGRVAAAAGTVASAGPGPALGAVFATVSIRVFARERTPCSDVRWAMLTQTTAAEVVNAELRASAVFILAAFGVPLLADSIHARQGRGAVAVAVAQLATNARRANATGWAAAFIVCRLAGDKRYQQGAAQ
jgi:hypothetical protein